MRDNISIVMLWAKNDNGKTALRLAAERENSTVLQLLLTLNASMNLPLKDGNTAIHLLVINGNTTGLELCLGQVTVENAAAV